MSPSPSDKARAHAGPTGADATLTPAARARLPWRIENGCHRALAEDYCSARGKGHIRKLPCQ
jgi:hypothetical protein